MVVTGVKGEVTVRTYLMDRESVSQGKTVLMMKSWDNNESVTTVAEVDSE